MRVQLSSTSPFIVCDKFVVHGLFRHMKSFHLTTESLLQDLLVEQKTEASVEEHSSLESFRKALEDLKADIASGKVPYSSVSSFLDESDPRIVLRKANAKFAASKRSPEARSASAQKGLETRKSNKASADRAAASMQASDAKEAENSSKREAEGFLPQKLDDYNGTPNPAYYSKDYTDWRSGISWYKLKPQHARTPILKGLSKEEAKEFLYPTPKHSKYGR